MCHTYKVKQYNRYCLNEQSYCCSLVQWVTHSMLLDLDANEPNIGKSLNEAFHSFAGRI